MAIFKTPSVDAILTAFNKTINDLEKLAEAKYREVERHEEAIENLALKKKEAFNEANKAAGISNKITKLISE